MEVEKLRREAEKARRAQNVNTVEKDARSFLPAPRKVGKASPSDKNLQKKLDKCFGPFEKLYPLLAKEESRLVGVQRYPQTPALTSESGSSSSLKLALNKKDSTAEPSHVVSASPSSHGANSLIKKVKDILVTPLSGIDGTPIDRQAFTFPDTNQKISDGIVNGCNGSNTIKFKVKASKNVEQNERLSSLTNKKQRNNHNNNNDVTKSSGGNSSKVINDKQNDVKQSHHRIDDDLRLSEDGEIESDEQEEDEGERRCNSVEGDNCNEVGFTEDALEEDHAVESNNNKMTPTTIKTKSSSSKSSSSSRDEVSSTNKQHVSHSQNPVDFVERPNAVSHKKSSMSSNGSTNDLTSSSANNQRQWDLKFFSKAADSLPKNEADDEHKRAKKSSADKQQQNATNVGGEYSKNNNVQIQSQENDASTSSVYCKNAEGNDEHKNFKISISKKNGVKLINNQQQQQQQKSSHKEIIGREDECKNDSHVSVVNSLSYSSTTNETCGASSNGGDERRKKKKKVDKGCAANHNSASNVPCTSSSIVAEPVSATISPSNGFVDTGSPNKENYSDYNRTRPSTTNSNANIECIINARKKSTTKNAETILQESRLSPLLSPIHEFPPFEYRNGIPSLICRLPLNLLTRIPPEPFTKSVKNEKDNHHLNGIFVDKSDSKPTSKNNTTDAAHRRPSSISPPPHLYPNCDISPRPSSKSKQHHKGISNGVGKNVNGANCDEACNKDLDDVPLERRKKICPDKKVSSEKINSCADSSSSNNVARPDEKRDGPSTHAAGTASTTSNNSKTSSTVEKTINDVAASLFDSKPPASVEKVERKKSASGSKRKIATSTSSSNDEKTSETPTKKPKLDNNFLMSVAPEKPVVLDCTVKDPKFYMDIAKEVKHRADGQGMDRTMRLVLYLESIMYFFLTGYSMEKTLNKESQRPFAMIKDTHELLKNVTQKYLSQLNELNETTQVLFVHKIEILSLRVQALLCCQMFSIKQSSILSNYRHINEYQKTAKDRPSSVHGSLSTATTTSSSSNENQTPSSTNEEKPASNNSNGIGGGGGNSSSSSRPNASTPSPTPSPASSTGSSSHSLPPGLVAIPQHVELLYKQQLNYLHNLLLAHHNWQLADSKLKQHDCAFFNHLDHLCRPLTLTSTVPNVCIYVLTAIQWLRQLHNQL